MLQTSTTNAKRTFVNLMRTESSIVSHMELSIYKTTADGRMLKKNIMIFMGYEYTVTFFDITTNKMKTITGIVDSVSGDNFSTSSHYLSMRYLADSINGSTNDSSCGCGCNAGSVTSATTTDEVYSTVTTGLPNCILNGKPSENKYSGPIAIDIPIANITDVVYIRGGTDPVPPVNKKGVKVVLLGISAEVCRAVVINLRLIDDDCSCEESVRDVNLKVGNCYTIAYFNNKDKAMYEFDGKLVSIQETSKTPIQNTVVRSCEQAGLNNSIYNSKCGCGPTSNTKDNYLSSEPMENDVLLTFDTSVDFSGEYQSIMLSWIRDCHMLSDEEIIDGGNSENGGSGSCTCNTKLNMTSGQVNIAIDTLSGEVKYQHNGDIRANTISLQEIMDFYFGCGC